MLQTHILYYKWLLYKRKNILKERRLKCQAWDENEEFFKLSSTCLGFKEQSCPFNKMTVSEVKQSAYTNRDWQNIPGKQGNTDGAPQVAVARRRDNGCSPPESPCYGLVAAVNRSIFPPRRAKTALQGYCRKYIDEATNVWSNWSNQDACPAYKRLPQDWRLNLKHVLASLQFLDAVLSWSEALWKPMLFLFPWNGSCKHCWQKELWSLFS